MEKKNNLINERQQVVQLELRHQIECCTFLLRIR